MASGKSTLFDAMIAAAGGPARRGAAPRGNTRIAHCTFLDEPWALIDCPGSVELAHEAEAALAVTDIALLVCDPDPARAPGVALACCAGWRSWTSRRCCSSTAWTPSPGQVRDTLAALQELSSRQLVLREVPIRDGEAITGYVDVVSERAYQYRRGGPSELIQLARQHAASGTTRRGRRWSRCWPITTMRCWKRWSRTSSRRPTRCSSGCAPKRRSAT